ncbi:hypothetical protein SUGI_0009430 [Cryptomeria japonica]|nr:hypothetical protein SUGI_0009430 [Cryptomeria japonica]
MESAGWENSVRFILRLWLASVLIYISVVTGQDTNGLDRLRLGYSSLSPQERETILLSPDGTFSAGFYNVGINAYCLTVWYSRGIPIWRTDTKGVGVKEALLLTTGNLVLRSDSEQIFWQSCDFPTDTFLPEQTFTKNSKLISRMELGNYKSGYYRFYFNDDNYLGLIYQSLNLSSKYWPPQPNTAYGVFDIGRTTYNITRLASLDHFGGFISSDMFSFNASDYGEAPLRRLTLDIDGNLRLYSLDSQNLTWAITWIALTKQCNVHGLCGFNEIVCIALGWGFLFRIFRSPSVHNYQGYSVVPGGLRRFKFSELGRATKNFKDSVGKGGFESVYKGLLLPKNKLVAVKRLEGVSQGEDEFRAELSMIGRVNHINLVQMLGFCAEGDQRLLVYEYVEKGSLDNYLFTHDSSRVLDWTNQFQIAVDTARGLAYLHKECLEWIFHCDIKPENILLDEHFHAKVSDFGLSKLVDKEHENDKEISALAFSKIRGTRGYLAPEWTMNLPITAKADICSFGILLLELLSGRKGAEFNVSGSNFVQWAFDSVRENRWTDNLVDPKLLGRDMEWKSKVEMERVLKTALLCIKQDKNKMPSMSRVVEILMLPISINDNGVHVEIDTEI